MNRKIREWISIHIAKNPGKVLLLAILMFNILFLLISALIISGMSLSGTEHMTFLEAAFCTVTMILDPGCIQFVVADIGHVSVGIVKRNTPDMDYAVRCEISWHNNFLTGIHAHPK